MHTEKTKPFYLFDTSQHLWGGRGIEPRERRKIIKKTPKPLPPFKSLAPVLSGECRPAF